MSLSSELLDYNNYNTIINKNEKVVKIYVLL